jgi:hypothetical protein
MNNHKHNVQHSKNYMNYTQNVSTNQNTNSYDQLPLSSYMTCGPMASSEYSTTHIPHQLLSGQSSRPIHFQNQIASNMLNQQQTAFQYPNCPLGVQFQAHQPYPNHMMNNFNQYSSQNRTNNPQSFNYPQSYMAFNEAINPFPYNNDNNNNANQSRSKSYLNNRNRSMNPNRQISETNNKGRNNQSYSSSSYKDRNYDKRRSSSRSRSRSRNRNMSYNRNSNYFKDNRRDDRSSRPSSYSTHSQRDKKYRSERKRSRSSESSNNFTKRDRSLERSKLTETEIDKPKSNLENEPITDQNECSYVQTTLIPIYYTKDSNVRYNFFFNFYF